ncbi:hypothetical protein RF11_14332 [Thelohanellus kitauei]|uniref:Uncharacterized protein n=1 Tax=Thelohanellus kitauei TaxID=669202 RepID=A0A0C2JEC6_THEKT|nr:hypothetical protein RF11_14332 [Thelohanellus kitauei]
MSPCGPVPLNSLFKQCQAMIPYASDILVVEYYFRNVSNVFIMCPETKMFEQTPKFDDFHCCLSQVQNLNVLEDLGALHGCVNYLPLVNFEACDITIIPSLRMKSFKEFDLSIFVSSQFSLMNSILTVKMYAPSSPKRFEVIHDIMALNLEDYVYMYHKFFTFIPRINGPRCPEHFKLQYRFYNRITKYAKFGERMLSIKKFNLYLEAETDSTDANKRILHVRLSCFCEYKVNELELEVYSLNTMITCAKYGPVDLYASVTHSVGIDCKVFIVII